MLLVVVVHSRLIAENVFILINKIFSLRQSQKDIINILCGINNNRKKLMPCRRDENNESTRTPKFINQNSKHYLNNNRAFNCPRTFVAIFDAFSIHRLSSMKNERKIYENFVLKYFLVNECRDGSEFFF